MTAHDFLTCEMWAVTDRPYSAEMLRMTFFVQSLSTDKGGFAHKV
jgi:hypothetical protein